SKGCPGGHVRLVLGGRRAGRVRRERAHDERDAADLADLLRMGRLPEAWIAPPEICGLREAIRHRSKLVAMRSALQGPGSRGAGQAGQVSQRWLTCSGRADRSSWRTCSST